VARFTQDLNPLNVSIKQNGELTPAS